MEGAGARALDTKGTEVIAMQGGSVRKGAVPTARLPRYEAAGVSQSKGPVGDLLEEASRPLLSQLAMG